MTKQLLALLFTALLAAPAAYAEDETAASKPQSESSVSTTQNTEAEEPIERPKLEQDAKFNYSPIYCDFVAGFPEDPVISYQCEKEDDPSTCFEQVTYTKVFDLSSTMRISMICNPSSKEMYDYFTPEVMEKTVKAMTKDSVVEIYKLKTNEFNKHKLTGLVGRGQKGLYDTMYVAQLWLSPNSIMSVEAELSGEQSPEADLAFANILYNTGLIEEIKGKEIYEKKLKVRADYIEKTKQLEEENKNQATTEEKN